MKLVAMLHVWSFKIVYIADLMNEEKLLLSSELAAYKTVLQIEKHVQHVTLNKEVNGRFHMTTMQIW